ncbi:MAG: hypothetical protein CVV41_17595 [Candidatus Riflebacteria bacterium HGW-Riflebacteria-1]|jgi:hypothetical protein|nr:MAG: hypothetical protein CVV41_17595 [Candidatus Riflebacteria bacterium HGW-Riflebacteria-1]
MITAPQLICQKQVLPDAIFRDFSTLYRHVTTAGKILFNQHTAVKKSRHALPEACEGGVVQERGVFCSGSWRATK